MPGTLAVIVEKEEVFHLKSSGRELFGPLNMSHAKANSLNGEQ